MKLTKVTITGADDKVNPGVLASLASEYPFVEWGILVSKKREGSPRYPSHQWIGQLIHQKMFHRQIQIAAHLCGEWAREATDGPFTWAIVRNQQFKNFDRIQLNGLSENPFAVYAVDSLSEKLDKEFIFQAPKGFAFNHKSISGMSKMSLLVDSSGGRGIPITEITTPPYGLYVGYAGGISHEKVEEIAQRVIAVPVDAETWIDCESGVRTNDEFDLDKVVSLLEKVKPLVSTS